MCAQDKTLGVTGDDRRLQEKARGGKGHAEGGGRGGVITGWGEVQGRHRWQMQRCAAV